MKVTVRRLMTLTLIVALAVWATTIVMRWSEYRQLARQHDEICEVLASEIEALSRQPAPAVPSSKIILRTIEPRSSLEEMKVALAAERRLAMKYRQAANQPWFGMPRGGQ